MFPLPKSAKLPKKYYTLSRKIFLSFILYSEFAVSSLFHATATVRFLGTSGDGCALLEVSCLSKEEEDGEEKSEVSLCRRVINMAHTPPPFPPPKRTYKKGDADAGEKKARWGEI